MFKHSDIFLDYPNDYMIEIVRQRRKKFARKESDSNKNIRKEALRETKSCTILLNIWLGNSIDWHYKIPKELKYLVKEINDQAYVLEWDNWKKYDKSLELIGWYNENMRKGYLDV